MHIRAMLFIAATLVGAWGCIDFEQERINTCEQVPEVCQSREFAPRIVAFDQKEDDKDLSLITLSVISRDPRKRTMTISWELNPRHLGTLSQPQPVATQESMSSAVIWTMPPCLPANENTPTITATVINDVGLSSSKSFPMTGLYPCPRWTEPSIMYAKRASHTATRLVEGEVLAAGGVSTKGPLADAELFNPRAPCSAIPCWEATQPLLNARGYHTATLLTSGSVLLTGGLGRMGVTLASSELYHPAVGDLPSRWALAASMQVPRSDHTATRLLKDGHVLVTGGYYLGMLLPCAEEYDPDSDSWSPVRPMQIARAGHTATLLPTGHVLVIGGTDSRASLSSLSAVTRSAAGGGPVAANVDSENPCGTPLSRALARAALAQTDARSLEVTPLATAELYDPEKNEWRFLVGQMSTPRYHHTATLLPSGKVLVIGGFSSEGAVASAEVLDPVTETWSPAEGMVSPRALHSAVLLTSGEVMVAAGMSSIGPLASTEIYSVDRGSWSFSSSLSVPRERHTMTLLLSGKVLLAGGSAPDGDSLNNSEVYAPEKAIFNETGSMNVPRDQHVTTVLPSGKVLATGGLSPNGPSSTVEVYDPATRTWSTVASMATARYNHTATLLTTGKVLVAGGDNVDGAVASAELYDPTSDTWSSAGSLTTGRHLHTANLLKSGNVLVTGGVGSGGPLSSAEEYNPATNSWTTTGSMTMTDDRFYHEATLLDSGKVLVTGGSSGSGFLSSTETYDPATRTWSLTSSMPLAYAGHKASLLLSGRVLVTGGDDNTAALKSAALYDPATNTWVTTGSMSTGRLFHTSTVLPSGKVLVTGGDGIYQFTATAEIYDPATGSWWPTAELADPRTYHAANLLPSGKVLISGGNSGTFLRSAEEYVP